MVLINWKFNQHFKEEDSNSEMKFLQFTKPIKPIKNVDNQSKKRKLSKDHGDQNSSVASSSNAIDDPTGKDETNAIDRPIKKGPRKGLKNKRKKLHRPANDGYFCDAPSK